MARGGAGPTLTIRERVLVHLAEYTALEREYDMPSQVTQPAIARATGIERRHVLQYLRPMIAAGLVTERVAHVEGSRQRRKAYGLSTQGRYEAARLRGNVLRKTVELEKSDGTRFTTTFGDAAEGPLRGTPLLELLRRQASQGFLREMLEQAEAETATSFAEMLSDAPKVTKFVGRRMELDEIAKGARRPCIFVIQGVAGIGKSWLGAKVCEAFRGRRHLFWDRVRAWDTPQSILARLGDFLSAAGKPGLKSILARGEASRAPEVLREDLRGNPALLVFDDAHEATAEVQNLFTYLKEAVAGTDGVTCLVLTRQSVPFYDRRDVALENLVKEIDLRGLESQDVVAFLSSEAAASQLIRLSRGLGGHPLSLELLRSGFRTPTGGQALRDVHRFLEENIFRELSPQERRIMKTACLYRLPVPREALLPDPDTSSDDVFSLMERSLIRPAGSDGLEVHDTIRDFFAHVLSPSERKSLGGFVFHQLQDLAIAAQETGNFVPSIGYLSNALQVSAPGPSRALAAEALGDADEKIGDLAGALTAYREALKVAKGREALARLHRKIASALQHRGELPSAAEEIESAFQALGPARSSERGWLSLVKTRIAYWRSEFGAAREEGQRALAAFEKFNDPLGQGETLTDLAWIELHARDGDRALGKRQLLAALDLAPLIADLTFTAQAHAAVAHMYAFHHPDVDRALTHLVAIQGIKEATDDPHILLIFLVHKAWFSLELLADFAAAESFSREAMAVARKLHDPGTIAFMRYNLALSSYFQGRVGEAKPEFVELAATWAKAWHRLLGAGPQFYTNIALLWMALESCLRDRDFDGFRRAVSAFGDPKFTHGIESYPIQIRVLRAVDLLLKDDWSGAEQHFREAVHIADRLTGTRMALLQSFAYLAPLYYGIALRVKGRDEESEKYLSHADSLIQGWGLKARRLALPDIQRELLAALHSGGRNHTH